MSQILCLLPLGALEGRILLGQPRSDILLLPAEIERLLDVATDEEHRVIIAASEGGLAPEDIGILTRNHVHNTPLGCRSSFRRTKAGNPVSIPVTPALGHLIGTTNMRIACIPARSSRP